MVEQSNQPLPSSTTEAPLPNPKKQATAEIGVCACNDEAILQTYCRKCDMALCNDCYFDYHGTCGKGMTLKQAAALQIGNFEAVLKSNNDAFKNCSDMANTVER